MIRKVLITLVAGVSLFAGVATAQNYSEKCELPKWAINLPGHRSEHRHNFWKILETIYHVHIYDASGNNREDMIHFFELGKHGKFLNHPEKPRYYGFDFNGNGKLEIEKGELCEKKVNNGKIGWYKVK
ncbi:hypothetical protein IIB50_03255 [Patescibacteria group bacterium]|nr:hypothetical protein [Patescibacteria group bacterium]